MIEDLTATRRDILVTHTLNVIALAATACLLANLMTVAAYLWAAGFLLMFCHVLNLNPASVAWRMVRKAVGHRFDTRFYWGELSPHWAFWRALRLGIRFDRATDAEDRNMLIVEFQIGSLYLYLPGRHVEWKDGVRGSYEPAYGFYTIDSQVIWRWGCGYYSWDIPFFSCRFESSEILTPGGRQVFIRRRGEQFGERRDEELLIAARYDERFRYTYTLRSGQTQERTAVVHVTRMTWSRKWFRWLKKIRTSIDVRFSEEVGERSGSWKGGCVGCGYAMLPGEQPVDTLRRMERCRKF